MKIALHSLFFLIALAVFGTTQSSHAQISVDQIEGYQTFLISGTDLRESVAVERVDGFWMVSTTDSFIVTSTPATVEAGGQSARLLPRNSSITIYFQMAGDDDSIEITQPFSPFTRCDFIIEDDFALGFGYDSFRLKLDFEGSINLDLELTAIDSGHITKSDRQSISYAGIENLRIIPDLAFFTLQLPETDDTLELVDVPGSSARQILTPLATSPITLSERVQSWEILGGAGDDEVNFGSSTQPFVPDTRVIVDGETGTDSVCFENYQFMGTTDDINEELIIEAENIQTENFSATMLGSEGFQIILDAGPSGTIDLRGATTTCSKAIYIHETNQLFLGTHHFSSTIARFDISSADEIRQDSTGSFSGPGYVGLNAGGTLTMDGSNENLAGRLNTSDGEIILNGETAAAVSIGDPLGAGAGILRGSSTKVSTLEVFPRATVAPGTVDVPDILKCHSARMSGNFRVRVVGTEAGTGYSQIHLCPDDLPTPSSLSLQGPFFQSGILEIVYAGGNFNIGDKLTIIRNDGTESVNGTFDGLPEGSIVKIGNVFESTISYIGGDGNDIVLTIIQIEDDLPTTTEIAFSDSDVKYGEQLTLTATVKTETGLPANRGTATFRHFEEIIATIPIDTEGIASIRIPATFLPGPHLFSVAYLGATGFLPSGSESKTVTVNPVSTVTTIEDISPIGPENPASRIRVTVSPSEVGVTTPEGIVEFTVDGQVTAQLDGATLVNGSAVVDLSRFSKGTYTLVAQFLAEEGFSASQSEPYTLEIEKTPTLLTVSSNKNPSIIRDTVTLSANLNFPGNEIPTGDVVFTIKDSFGDTVDTVTAPFSLGDTSVSYTFSETDQFEIVANFEGNNDFTQSQSEPLSQTVDPVTIILSFDGDPIEEGTTNSVQPLVTRNSSVGSLTILLEHLTSSTASALEYTINGELAENQFLHKVTFADGELTTPIPIEAVDDIAAEGEEIVALSIFPFPGVTGALDRSTIEISIAMNDLVVTNTDDFAVDSSTADTMKIGGEGTLRRALINAELLDFPDEPRVVTFSDGTEGSVDFHSEARTIEPQMVFSTAGNITVRGPAPPSMLTIDNNDQGGHFGISANTLRLENLRLVRSGTSAISIGNGASCFVDHCVFQDNFGIPASAIYAQGDCIVENSYFLENNGAFGGAVIAGLSDGVNLRIENTTLSNNSANPGCIRSEDGELRILNSTISGNSGSAVFSRSSALIIENSTLYDNEGGLSGGIDTLGIAVINNSILANNRVTAGSQIARNVSARQIIGDYNIFGVVDAAILIPQFLNNRYGSSFFPLNPRLLPLADNGGPAPTHDLEGTSPALNNGNPEFDVSALPFDQRGAGFSRQIGHQMDIGSVEHQNAPPVATAPEILGAFLPGNTLTTEFVFGDEDGDEPDIHLYQWYEANSPGAVGSRIGEGQQLVLTSTSLGKFIFAEITPFSQSGIAEGLMVTTPYFGPVEKVSTTLSLTKIPTGTEIGEPINLRATAAPIAPGVAIPQSGTVSFYDGSTFLGIRDLSSEGWVGVQVSDPQPGLYSFRAVYSGNDSFFGSESESVDHKVLSQVSLETISVPNKEDDGDIIMRLTRDGDLSVPLTATLGIGETSAILGEDFEIPDAQIIPAPAFLGGQWALFEFPVNVSTLDVRVSVAADNLDENDEIFYLQLRTHSEHTILGEPLHEFTITDDDDTPIATNDQYSVVEDGILTISDAALGIIANDADTDDGIAALSASVISPTTRGQLQPATDGTFTYVPERDFFGTDSFTYTLSDGTNISAPATVTIEVFAQVDFTITARSSRNPVLAGIGLPGNLTHTVTITNNGPSDATSANAPVTLVLPAGVTLPGGSITSLAIASLAEGASMELPITFSVDDSSQSGEKIVTTVTGISASQSLINTADDNTSVATEIATSEAVDTLEIDVTPVLRTQSGLFQQRLTITNSNRTPVPGFRILVRNIPDDVTVFNQSGVNEAGLPFLEITQSLTAGEKVEILVEFYRLSRDPNIPATYEIQLLDQQEPSPLPAGDRLQIDRFMILPSGEILIEWPATDGKNYGIEYSEDFTVWKKAKGMVPANDANRLQWIDSGLPETDSHPSTVPTRYYRIVEVAE